MQFVSMKRHVKRHAPFRLDVEHTIWKKGQIDMITNINMNKKQETKNKKEKKEVFLSCYATRCPGSPILLYLHPTLCIKRDPLALAGISPGSAIDPPTMCAHDTESFDHGIAPMPNRRLCFYFWIGDDHCATILRIDIPHISGFQHLHERQRRDGGWVALELDLSCILQRILILLAWARCIIPQLHVS